MRHMGACNGGARSAGFRTAHRKHASWMGRHGAVDKLSEMLRGSRRAAIAPYPEGILSY